MLNRRTNSLYKFRHQTAFQGIIQIMVTLLHLFLLLIGGMVIYVGATWSFHDKILSSYFLLFFRKPGNTVILLGISIVIISLMGFCVTCFTKDVTITKMHMLFMVLIVLCQSAYSIDILALNQLPSLMKSNLFYGINYYRFNHTDEISIAWDIIQRNRQCCGVYSYYDWYECDECMSLNSFPGSCCEVGEQAGCRQGNMNSMKNFLILARNVRACNR